MSNIVVFNGTPTATTSARRSRRWAGRPPTRGPLSFGGCRVPEGNLLGPRGEGFHQFLEILDGGRISVAALGLGLAQGAYEQALAYARERQQFGRPIGELPGGPVHAGRHGRRDRGRPRTSIYKAAWLKDQGRPFAQAASMAKLYTGELARRAANASLQIHGGYGYMDEFADLALLPRREDPRDRRGHERGAAPRDRPGSRTVVIFEQVVDGRPRLRQLRRRLPGGRRGGRRRPAARRRARCSRSAPPRRRGSSA